MDASYKFTGGLINGLTGLPSGTDSTGTNKNIPPEIQAIIAKRRAKDKTPVWNREDGLKAIREGFKGMDKKTQDSLAATFDHDAYEKHLATLGLEIAKKKSQ